MEELSEDYPRFVRQGEERWMALFDDIVMNEAGPYYFRIGNWRISSLQKLLMCGVQLVLTFRAHKLKNLEA
jgi:hypothetical protein